MSEETNEEDPSSLSNNPSRGEFDGKEIIVNEYPPIAPLSPSKNASALPPQSPVKSPSKSPSNNQSQTNLLKKDSSQSSQGSFVVTSQPRPLPPSELDPFPASGEGTTSKDERQSSSVALPTNFSAPKIEKWDENSNALADVPDPITKKLQLPEFHPPEEVDEDFGKKTNSWGLTCYAYIVGLVFILVAIYSIAAGFVILQKLAGVIQLVGFLNHPNKPVKHMFYTLIVNFVVFSVFLVAVIQVLMEKYWFDFAKETFILRFARFQYRFEEKQIKGLYQTNILIYVIIIIAAGAALVCLILALVQCCYYIPGSWWNLICCVILPVSVIVLTITAGIVFLCSSFFVTPFAHTTKDNFKYEEASTAGKYLETGGMILLFLAAGLIVYIVVVIFAARCYYNHKQAEKADKGMGWPNADEVTYDFFRKKDFVLPFGNCARTVLGIFLGLVSLVVVLIVVFVLWYSVLDKEYKFNEGREFIREKCNDLNYTSSVYSLSSSSSSLSPSLFTLLSSSSVSLTLPHLISSTPTPHLSHQHTRTRVSRTRTHQHTLGYQEIDPCKDAWESVWKYNKTIPNIKEKSTNADFAAEHLTKMTEATRNLITITSFLAIAPLFPVLVVAVLLLVLLILGICFGSILAMFICDSKDKKSEILKDMDEWDTQAQGTITREQDFNTLKKEKKSLEERAERWNNSLDELTKEREGIQGSIDTWKTQSQDYQNSQSSEGLGAQYDKLQKDRLSLAKNILNFNKKVNTYL